jgi:pseudouridine-5'-phosphate glycosidase
VTPALTLAPAVATALASGRPVVALESTIIAHGLPYPRNLETARSLEQAVRDAGGVPATVAVWKGKLQVGLEAAELAELAQRGPDFRKLSTRDLPLAVAREESGATTVAATMACAARAGIRVFATGGIGGVHRGADHSFDVSADLLELSRTRVAVVCSGPKAILDLPRTLEALETLGVPAVGYQTDELPSFYSRGSGLALPARCDTPDEVARLLEANVELGLPGGVLIANPPPADRALPRERVETAVEAALAAARRRGVTGKDVTPFLLAAVARETGGASVDANVALATANARLAAEIAGALSRSR